MFYNLNVGILILGIALLYIGVDYYIVLDQIEKKGLSGVGKIISYRRSSRGYQTPVVNFYSQCGVKVEDEPYYSVSDDFNKFKNFNDRINSDIKIKYYSKQPEKFIIDVESSYSRLPIILLIIGGLIFVSLGSSSLLGLITVVK